MTSGSRCDSQGSITRNTNNRTSGYIPSTQAECVPSCSATVLHQYRTPPSLEESFREGWKKRSFADLVEANLGDGAAGLPNTHVSIGLTRNSTSLGLDGGMAAQAAAPRPNEGGSAAAKPQITVEESGGGEAAVRLDKRTHLDQGKYRVKIIDYGNGLGEIGWSFIPSLPPKQVGKGQSEAREENEDRAIRRAKSRMRQLILASGVDHLTTLTYRENVTDFERADSDFKRFVRSARRSMPGWAYVAVPERQKRGAWHWHLAVKGRQDVDLLRRLWRHVVGEGNIDVQAPRGKGEDRRLLLVRYLGKYLVKGFKESHRELNGRRYRASLGIEVPMSYLTVPEECRGDVAGFALSHLVTVAGTVGFVWIADDKPAGWACSWK